MTKSFFSRKWFAVFSLLFFMNSFFRFTTPLFAENEKTWVVAAEKFDFESGIDGNDSVKAAIPEIIPSRIIENLSSFSYRTIYGDEELDRTLYKLRNERISLYLQLSSEIRSKDAIFLNDYSEQKIQSLKNEIDKKILSIQEKIDANTEAQKKAEEKAIKKANLQATKSEKTEGQKYISFIKGLVSSEDLSLSSERVVFYEKNDSNFYEPSEYAKANGYESYVFVKEMVEKKIDSLITGKISFLGDYLTVTTEVFVYPGGKSAGVVTEIGSINDVEFICRSIAHQISPLISAVIPVIIKLNVKPESALESLKFYIDEIAYREWRDEYVISSGVHSLRFDAEGYKTAVTSFNFDGESVYNVDVELQEKKSGNLSIKLKKPLVGSIYGNGEFGQNIDEENQIANIKINDTVILGHFISEDGSNGFYYVPEDLLLEDTMLTVNIKSFDKSEYIDKSRRRMYTSYSVFFVSFLTYFVSYFTAQNYYGAYLNNRSNLDLVNTTNAWSITSNVCLGTTVAAGCWFGFELFRYLKAADYVLPANAKKLKSN